MEIFDGRNEKIRLIIFSLSFIWFFFGMSCMLKGGYTHGFLGNQEKEFKLSELGLANYAIALIPIGSFVVIISFFGCCAAIKGSRRMTFSTLSALCVLAFTKFLVGCILLSNFNESIIREKVTMILTDVLNTTEMANVTDKYAHQFSGVVPIYSKHIHDIHEKYYCCGVTGPDFYPNNDIPHSCCPVGENDTPLSKFHRCNETAEFLKEGCLESVQLPKIIESKTELGVFLIVISIFEFLIGIFELFITKNIKEI